jgi:tubulin-like protein
VEIHHPLLYVGLGGTGGKIGAELERWLRRRLCGPDGANVIGVETRKYLPFELPSCFQFVYVDMDQRDLDELRRATAPDGDHDRAISRTAHIMTDLVPVQRTYPEVAQSLRTRAEQQVRDWLPPADGEPNIAPLWIGAGQLPTIARASLFHTLTTSGLAAVQRPLRDAIDALAGSGEELAALGGSTATACDVFVGFSVAGGTGGGVFYDYLHLIADAFRETAIDIQIHPIVVMPSAIPLEQGGGDMAKLNAGRALLDLSRLVDDQNMRAADKAWRSASSESDKGLSVVYPVSGEGRLRIDPATVQTAYLFSQTTGLRPPDLHRSIVSFILSVSGARGTAGGAEGQGLSQSFLNQGVKRQTLAPSGIGSCSMSTAAVASLSVPREEILDIVGAHLLAEAVREADDALPGEDNKDLVRTFLAQTRLTDLEHTPNHARGVAGSVPTGRGRVQALQQELRQLEHRLRREDVPAMAREFKPWQGLLAMLAMPQEGDGGPVDLLRAERAIFGSKQESWTVTEILEYRGTPLSLEDPPPDGGDGALDQWMDQQVEALWHQAWTEQRPVWHPKMQQFGARLHALTEALRAHRSSDKRMFDSRVADLFADRHAAPYFLPDLPRNGEDFYRQLAERLAGVLRVETADPSATSLLTELLGKGLWQRVAEDSDKSGPGRAVAILRRLIYKRIRQETNGGAEFIPHLADLLAAASGIQRPVAAADQERFHDKLGGLIPPGFLMRAAGQAKVLLTYPVRSVNPDADDPAEPLAEDGATGLTFRVPPDGNADIERFIKETISRAVGRQPGRVEYEFRPTAEEAITAVMIRTALGVTEVHEVRDVMNFWSHRLSRQKQGDYLRWRQRLGYHYDWLLTTEEQRIDITQRLLIAMRNGQATVLAGTEEKPTEIEFRVSAEFGPDVPRLQLSLRPFGPTSPWGGLLAAYEESTLAGDELNRQDMYRSLMDVQPELTEEDKPGKAADIYEMFHKVAEKEIESLIKVRDKLRVTLRTKPQSSSARLRRIEILLEFWQKIVPAAREKEFAQAAGFYHSLDELDDDDWG